MERAREVLGKVAERDEFRASRSLGEAQVRPITPNPKDAAFWLKALRTNDPEWQRRERRNMHKTQRTDPEWRREQNNGQGDGGYSWTQHTTRLSYSPLTELAP